MAWDGIRRRDIDNGKEDPAVVMARIDERLANHIVSFENYKKEFSDHKIDDASNFKLIFRMMWIGVGIIATLQFILGLHK